MAVLSTLAVLLGFGFALPLAWRLTPEPRSKLEVTLAGLGLSVGLLSLGMLALGLACRGCVQVRSLLAWQTVVLSIGLWLSRDAWRAFDWRGAPGRTLDWVHEDAGRAGVVAVLSLGAGLILLSNVYYPFNEYDELARYAYEARLTYEAGGLPPDVFGYPQLVQFNYAYAFIAFGGLVEWAARLTPSLLAAGTLGAAIALGRALLDEQAGLLAGLALLLTPIVARWATTGYVDVPLAFMVTMAALALYRWQQRKTAARAAWAGLWFGLALWTKQSALLHLGGAGLFVGLTLFQGQGWRRADRWLATLRDGLLVLGVSLLVAGAWYARNVMLGGWPSVFPSPSSFATSRARPRLHNLIPFTASPDSFGQALSYLYAAGLLLTLAVAIGLSRRKRGEAWGARLLACLTLPHILVWWQRYSYNPRHLLPIVPLVAVMSGYALRLALESAGGKRRLLAGAAALLVVGLAWPAGLVYYASAPNRILLDPIGDVEARRYDALDESYVMVHAILQEVPPGARIYTMDGRMQFYLGDYELRSGYPFLWDDLADFDYVVSAEWAQDVYERLGHADSPVLAAIASGDDPRLRLVERSGDFALFEVALHE